jgi:hypothetical protein
MTPAEVPQAAIGRDRLIFAAIVIASMVAMIAPELGYVPIWDGRVYANCVLDAAYNGISMESLRCANHPSQGWGIVLAVPQLFAPGSVAVLNGTNLVLGIGAVFAFRIVLGRLFPSPDRARELDLVALCVAWHPVVLSTLVQPNVDFGVYVFFFVALAGLLTPTRGGTATAIIGGTLLAFSKETGVAAYGLAVGATLLAEHRRSGLAIRARLKTIASRGAILAVPLILFVAHTVQWRMAHGTSAIWRHAWQQSSSDGFKWFDLSEPIFLSYAAGLFVLGFMWVAWLPVAADAVIGLRRIGRGGARNVAGADPHLLPPIIALSVVLTYLLTSFRTWSNLRYFAVLYPLFLLLTHVSLVRLGVSARARTRGLMAIAALFLLADFRSVDPLSRAVYGTFDTGVRRMYAMTSITGEFEGPGRDQLVYNLEFTGYHHVQNALFALLKPGAETVIATPRIVRWNIWSQLEPGTWRRTMSRTDAFAPVYADEADVSARGSADAWYLTFSNGVVPDRALDGLLKRYAVTDSMVAAAHGQRVVARHLVRRESSVLP